MELRHGGAWYHISPWGLSWDDENYYMIGYDTEAQLIKHYRVDKMLHIRMSDESVREKNTSRSWIWRIMPRRVSGCSGKGNVCKDAGK